MWTLFFISIAVVCLYSVPPIAAAMSECAPEAKFPYGISTFSWVVQNNIFYCDKTSYIPRLQSVGRYNKIWRPRRFGKSLVCDMLTEYYDAATCKDEVGIFYPFVHFLCCIKVSLPITYVCTVDREMHYLGRLISCLRIWRIRKLESIWFWV